MKNMNSQRIAKFALLAATVVVLAACSGCMKKYINGEYGVERFITIKSDPPGARLLVDNEEVGTTPQTLGFVHYGTRRITVIADGYRTISTLERISPPWYQYFPLDMLFELVLPVKMEDHHRFLFKLEPEPQMDVREFIKQAEEFRDKEREGP